MNWEKEFYKRFTHDMPPEWNCPPDENSTPKKAVEFIYSFLTQQRERTNKELKEIIKKLQNKYDQEDMIKWEVLSELEEELEELRQRNINN